MEFFDDQGNQDSYNRERSIREQRHQRELARKRRKQQQRRQSIAILAVFLVLILVIVGVSSALRGGSGSKTAESETSEVSEEVSSTEISEESSDAGEASEQESETTVEETGSDRDTVLETANRQAASYDYDTAIETIQAYSGYENDAEMTQAIEDYKTQQAACVPYDKMDQITHVFFHTLINDPSLAFDGDDRSASYNEVSNTVEEFKKILQQMYDNGYVIVSIYDVASYSTDENGNETMTMGQIYLPEGKTPYVLSQDVSYYHYEETDGYSERMMLDEDGNITCKYVDQEGNVTYGAFDVVPIVDEFIEEHPDASYRGAKGILGMTGYEGLFGYRVDPDYNNGGNGDEWKTNYLAAHPDFDYEQECEDCKALCDALKEDGWVFASHTYHHLNYQTIDYDDMVADQEKWLETVEPFTGSVDIILFPYGADVGDWHEYASDNERWNYLQGQGYRYYCNVDSNTYWLQCGTDYFRQGRRNLDGYRMWQQISGQGDYVSDLFDAESVFDEARPTPVE